MACKYVTYLRVSSRKQGASGLGLEDQRATVEAHARANGCRILNEFQETESGRNDARPQLALAIALARQTGAVLLVARLDRLLRSVSFLEKLRDAKVAFQCCDMPDANEMTITIMAALAKQEAVNIGRNTKAALAVAKRNGPKEGKKPIGNPKGAKAFGAAGAVAYQQANARNREIAKAHAETLAPMVATIMAQGTTTLSGIAAALNEREATTTEQPRMVKDRATGELKPYRGRWHASSVANLLKRLPQTAA